MNVAFGCHNLQSLVSCHCFLLSTLPTFSSLIAQPLKNGRNHCISGAFLTSFHQIHFCIIWILQCFNPWRNRHKLLLYLPILFYYYTMFVVLSQLMFVCRGYKVVSLVWYPCKKDMANQALCCKVKWKHILPCSGLCWSTQSWRQPRWSAGGLLRAWWAPDTGEKQKRPYHTAGVS